MAAFTLKRVFVVDDEVLIAQALAAILTQNGFSVTAFNNPQHALEAALMDPPDLLISDVVMPELSGVQLAIQITPKLPAVRSFYSQGRQIPPICSRMRGPRVMTFICWRSQSIRPTYSCRSADITLDRWYRHRSRVASLRDTLSSRRHQRSYRHLDADHVPGSNDSISSSVLASRLLQLGVSVVVPGMLT
jgi:CheY-like chemotaxis protein